MSGSDFRVLLGMLFGGAWGLCVSQALQAGVHGGNGWPWAAASFVGAAGVAATAWYARWGGWRRRPVAKEQGRAMSDDFGFRAEDLCFCQHEHHRHDMGHGCLDCGCGGFRDSIHNLRGLLTDGRAICQCGHVGSRHGHYRGVCEAIGCVCSEFR